MRELQDRRRVNKFIYSKFVAFTLGMIILLFAHAVWGVYDKYVDAKENAESAQRSLASLEKRKEVLEDRLAYIGTERGTEAEIRKKFMVAKEGEQVLVLVDPETTDVLEPAEKRSLWERFLGVFR